jgi:hypothetical protein
MTPREPLWADMVSSLTLFMIGGLVLAFVLAGRLDMTAYLLAHVGCAAAAFLLTLRQRPRPRRQALLLALATTSMGPAGAAGVFICTIFELCFRPYATPFTEWFASIFPEEGDKSRQGFLDLLHSSEDPVTTSLRISSFRDTISAGTIEQKQALLGLIARRFSPAFAPALHQALADPVPAVRVQAAAAVAAIEGRFAERTFQLQARSRRPGSTADDHFALARHLIEFSEAGIAEPQRVDEARNAALLELDTVLSLLPGHVAALTASAGLLLKMDRAAEAMDRINRSIDAKGNSAQVAALQLQAMMALGQYEEIRSLAARWLKGTRREGHESERLRAAAAMWQRGAAHAG